MNDDETKALLIEPGLNDGKDDVENLRALLTTILYRANSKLNSNFTIQDISEEEMEFLENGQDYFMEENCDHEFAISKYPYDVGSVIDINSESIPDDAVLLCVRCNLNFDFMRTKKEAKESA